MASQVFGGKMNATGIDPRCKRGGSAPLIVLVHDECAELHAVGGRAFPGDATAEWETEQTIEAIAEAWSSLGFDVERLGFGKEFPADWERLRKSAPALVHSLLEGWGSPAREAWIPGLCELHGIPFIGSPSWTQSLCMSKAATRALAAECGLPVAPAAFIGSEDDLRAAAARPDLFPAFLKPDAEGSGMGIDASHSLVDAPLDLVRRASALLLQYPDGLLCERRLEGEEFTVSLIGQPLRALPTARIEVPGGIYGLAWKGKDAMEESVTFPELPESLRTILSEGSLRLAVRLGCRDFVRVDWRCDAAGAPHFLEANPLAGLSPYYSTLPLTARYVGISLPELLALFAEGAFARFAADGAAERSLRYGRSRLQKPPKDSD